MSNSETNARIPLFARQPIFNQTNEVIGYELLFRPADSFREIDGDMATAQVILNSFAESTLAVAVNDTCAFINFTDTWLLKTPPFGPENVVIEILESVTVTPKLISRVKILNEQGYKIALDDFEMRLGMNELIPFSSIIKIDVLEHSSSELAELVEELRKYPVQLLAEKIEDYEMFRECRRLGFELYQGYYFCKPEIVEEKVTKTNRLATLELLAKLNDPDVEIDDLEVALKKDPILTVKLLKLINSAHYARHQKIDCLNKAIITLGLDGLKRWITLVVLTGMDDKPNALLCNVLIRARMMEIISSSLAEANPTLFFFVGLLSQIDAFFDTELDVVINSLPLDDWMNEAILQHKGQAGELLHLLKSVEIGNWGQLEETKLPISTSIISSAYIESIEWANNLISGFASMK